MYAVNVSNSALLPIHYHCPGLSFVHRYQPGAVLCAECGPVAGGSLTLPLRRRLLREGRRPAPQRHPGGLQGPHPSFLGPTLSPG